MKVPKDHINILHIGDTNMPFLSSKLGHSAISSPRMEPFDMITVLLRDDIAYQHIHAVHVQFGQYELVSLPYEYNLRGTDARKNLKNLLNHINQLIDILPAKIVDNLKAAHRLITKRGVPDLMVSTWARFGQRDQDHTIGVKEAVDNVIFAVNTAIRNYVNEPLPLESFIFCMDIWRE